MPMLTSGLTDRGIRPGKLVPANPDQDAPEDSSLPRVGALERAIVRLRELIWESNLDLGAKLPSERELAKRFGIGRPTLREAIRALSIMGVLETRRGSGTYVTSPLTDLFEWPARILLDESNVPLIELLEVRRMFEPKAAGLAASRANASQLRRIESHLKAQEASPRREVLEREDLLFHQAIIDAAGNPVLRELASTLQPMLTMSRKLTARTTPDIPKIIRQHRIIYEAISVGQSELAEAAMTQHLRTVGLDIISEAVPGTGANEQEKSS
jgi:GntR family transcriptional repressor for pyruvate dehydrogenase complex